MGERDWVDKQLDDPEFRKNFLDELARQHTDEIESVRRELEEAKAKKDEWFSYSQECEESIEELKERHADLQADYDRLREAASPFVLEERFRDAPPDIFPRYPTIAVTPEEYQKLRAELAKQSGEEQSDEG